jgi:hypothetical protein
MHLTLCHISATWPTATGALETLGPALKAEMLTALLLVPERCPELLNRHHPTLLHRWPFRHENIASLFVRLSKIDIHLVEIVCRQQASVMQEPHNELPRIHWTRHRFRHNFAP